jgi:hypothetical protein
MIEFVTHYTTPSGERIEIKVDGTPVSIYLRENNTIEVIGSVSHLTVEKDAANSAVITLTP